MSINISSFGKTHDGKEVHLFTLSNLKGFEASFTDIGGAWVTMLVPDKKGKVRDVILGYDKAEYYENNSSFFGEPVGRNANRIAGGKFTLDNKIIDIGANEGGKNNLHSGPDFWFKRLWTARTEEVELGSKVIFSLKSPDNDQGFPGNATVTVSYTLTDDSVMIDYAVTSDKTTLCNMTNHCYFNLAGHDSADAMDQEVWIGADAFTPADELSIPTGEIRPVKGTPFDFEEMKPIKRDIDADDENLRFGSGYDHNWVLNRYDKSVRLVAKAKDPASGLVMKVHTDMPGMQFYTGNHIKNVHPGKNGVKYEARSGYCFETQFFPNAINTENFVKPILKAGETFKSCTIYQFGE